MDGEEQLADESGWTEKPLNLMTDFEPHSTKTTNWCFMGDVAISGLCWVGVGATAPIRVQAWVPKVRWGCKVPCEGSFPVTG